jgi:hypothetical protein
VITAGVYPGFKTWCRLMIKVTDIEQGTKEWFALRLGIPTSSEFSKILTSKGKLSQSASGYRNTLIGEILLGKPEETYESYDMMRAKELEPEARDLFSMIYNIDVEQVTLCYYDKRKDRSCSPDGMLPTEEGLEIKCPKLATHIGYLLSGKFPSKYFHQVQGSMYITGFKSWFFMSYYPGLDPFIIEVKRDDEFCNNLDKAIDEFNKILSEDLKKVQ